MTVWGVILAGTIGSWVGAAAMYRASRLAGRPLALRYGKYFFISAAKIEAAERSARRRAQPQRRDPLTRLVQPDG